MQGADRSGVSRFATEIERRLRDVVKQALMRFMPAAILGWLGVVQSVDALRGGVLMTANPGWPIAVNVVREILYGAFMLGAAVILGTSTGPRLRDGRARVFVASMVATFLLVGVGLMPTGPVAWEATVRSFQIGLLIAVVGASLAVVALVSLGSNFSIVPEAQSLVVTGPYRWLRHPMYSAEFLMMLGIALSDPRIAFLIGAIGVFALQVYRIRMEEQLLLAAFPHAYEEFVTRTRYRLIPHVW